MKKVRHFLAEHGVSVSLILRYKNVFAENSLLNGVGCKKLENRKEVKRMNYLYRASAYLNSVTSTVSSLCDMILSNELQGKIEVQYKIAVELFELEQATYDFILGMELDFELSNAVVISKRKFMNINEHLIKHLEKIQLQGYRFDELITTLKLETETLKEEVRLS